MYCQRNTYGWDCIHAINGSSEKVRWGITTSEGNSHRHGSDIYASPCNLRLSDTAAIISAQPWAPLKLWRLHQSRECDVPRRLTCHSCPVPTNHMMLQTTAQQSQTSHVTGSGSDVIVTDRLFVMQLRTYNKTGLTNWYQCDHLTCLTDPTSYEVVGVYCVAVSQPWRNDYLYLGAFRMQWSYCNHSITSAIMLISIDNDQTVSEASGEGKKKRRHQHASKLIRSFI